MFIRSVSQLSGLRRNLTAFGLGVFATLALPPLFLLPLLIPAFCGLYLLIQQAPNSKRAFWDGWWWGWGFYMSGLYWFVIALMTDPDKFAWLVPFALFGLTAVIAIYSGVACLLYYKLRRGGIAGIFIFSVVWTCIEFARGHLFTGFPWNLQGYSFAVTDSALQLASLIGAYGLTWWAVWLATIPAAFFFTDKKSARLLVAGSYILCATLVWWGAWRLYQADIIPKNERYVEGVTLRLVQANIEQPHKWDPKLRMQGVQEYIALTHAPGLDKVTHIIWPETAVPFALAPGSGLMRLLGASIPPGKILITGALREEGQSDADWQIWNSLVAINHDGALIGSYDKYRLVPFGEFLPLRWLLPASWLTPVGAKDFSRGPGGQTLEWPGLPPLMPLVCYEVIFPELAADAPERPQLLLNVTNDAWFGFSTGPYQHFTMARMRSVEQGVPLVRVANTGITAVTDSYGRVEKKLALGKRGVIDIKLQKAQPYDTPYSKCNNIFIQLLILIVIVLIWRRKQDNNV